MRPPLRRGLALLLALALAGCGEPEPRTIERLSGDEARVLRKAREGAVAAVLVPHRISRLEALSGLHRALRDASRGISCSAAVFFYERMPEAERWIVKECERRRDAGRRPFVILGGHSWGATAAGELAKRLLRSHPDVTISLLVTVDAIKSGTLGSTTGAAATLLTLNNPVPGKKATFVAYDDTPPVDGQRLLAHTNYYQTDTTFAHGSRIRGASENHYIPPGPGEAVNHGNVDDYAYPLLVGDFRQALREGARP